MSGENSKNDNTTVLGLASAIVSKINSLISSHNSNTSAHSDKESTSNKVTSWSSTVSDTKYASEKLIKDSLDAKQNALVSGTSIKTINNNSILGSGNLTIESGSGGSNITNYYYDTSNNEIILEYDSGVTQADIVSSWSSTTSDTNVPSEKLTKDSLDGKADSTHSHGLLGSDGTISSSMSSFDANATPLVKGSSGELDVCKFKTDKIVHNSALSNLGISTGQTKTQFEVNEAINTALGNKISTSNTSGLVKNDGSIDTNTYLTSHQDISNYVQKSNTSGLLKNDGSVMTGGTGSTNYAIGNHTHSDYLTEMKIGSTSGLPVKTTTNGVLTTGSFGTTSGTFAEGNHTHSAYVNPTIADNLTTDNSSQVLSAKQGKVLNDKIGNIIQIINGTGS